MRRGRSRSWPSTTRLSWRPTPARPTPRSRGCGQRCWTRLDELAALASQLAAGLRNGTMPAPFALARLAIVVDATVGKLEKHGALLTDKGKASAKKAK